MDVFGKEHLAALDHNFIMSAKAHTALDILKTHPLVAARLDGEDSAGRQKVREVEVAELLERVFALADGFIEGAYQRGWIKQVSMSSEDAAKEIGRLRGITERAQYDRKLQEPA